MWRTKIPRRNRVWLGRWRASAWLLDATIHQGEYRAKNSCAETPQYLKDTNALKRPRGPGAICNGIVIYISTAQKFPNSCTLRDPMCVASGGAMPSRRNGGDQRSNARHTAKLWVPNNSAQISLNVSLNPLFLVDFDGVVVLYLHLPQHSAEQNLNWGPRPCLKVPSCKSMIGERRRKDFGAP